MRVANSVLTPKALEFVNQLVEKFEPKRQKILTDRTKRGVPWWLPETENIRRTDWVCAKIPDDMKIRTVEITGPVDRKMIINGLNSGADVFMADFEDSTSPTWSNIIDGQENLYDAVRRNISLETAGKTYTLNPKIAKLMVRPRGWHLNEKHYGPMSASLFDFGLFFFHNAKIMVERGETPAFYLPKLEHYNEAALWAEVFAEAEALLEIPHGTIRATVLIETLPAAFQMNEILWVLGDYAAGLNAGRWDYIFSAIKHFANDRDRVFPNRSQVTMESPSMSVYAKLLIHTCHRRGVHAMGGMSAYIPRKDDEGLNRIAMSRVSQDKAREALMGHDGTWVAHPGLVDLARKEFLQANSYRAHDAVIENEREDAIGFALLSVPYGEITYAELCNNVRVCLQYMASWMQGKGCVPLNHLMEDMATAEISRAQVWQWCRWGVEIDGERLDWTTICVVIDQEAQKLIDEEYAPTYIIEYVADKFTEMTNARPSEFPLFIADALYGDLGCLKPDQP